MKISELIEKLTEEGNEEEVFVERDGLLCDFEIESVPESFDGFDQVYPACYKLVVYEEFDD